MFKKITSRWDHQSTVKVEWNIGRWCNYDCSYCPKVIHDNTSKHTDIKLLKSAVDNLCQLQKTIRLSFTGGEPTAHPNLPELIKYCRLKNINWINLTTNTARTFTYYNNLNLDHYVFSIHFEFNYKKSIDTILKFSKEINLKKYIVHLMAHHDYMETVKTVADLLATHNIPHAIRRIRWTEGNHDVFDDFRYNDTDLEWILNYHSNIQPNCILDDNIQELLLHANDVIKLHKNQFKGWTCNAGLESLMINWDGDVYRATCRVGGSLGNIYNGTFTVPTNPVVCNRDWCTCAADIPLTKIIC